MSKRFPQTNTGGWAREAAAVNSEAPDRLAACPKCGDLARPGRVTCAACGSRLYPKDAA